LRTVLQFPSPGIGRWLNFKVRDNLLIFVIFLLISFPETKVVTGLTIFGAFFVYTSFSVLIYTPKLTLRMDIKEKFGPKRF
jgi:hypothetical protein